MPSLSNQSWNSEYYGPFYVGCMAVSASFLLWIGSGFVETSFTVLIVAACMIISVLSAVIRYYSIVCKRYVALADMLTREEKLVFLNRKLQHLESARQDEFNLLDSLDGVNVADSAMRNSVKEDLRKAQMKVVYLEASYWDIYQIWFDKPTKHLTQNLACSDVDKSV